MSKYYIYQMTAITEDGSKGSYIGQHKIGRKSPLEDGYKGSGSDWKKYILSQNIPVEKIILRMCDNIEEANYWENYYIESAKAQGIYLWNKYKGGGGHEYNKIYTEEELKEHKREYDRQYKEANREKIAEHNKQYYYANREKRVEYSKQYYEVNREKIAEYSKQYNKQYREANKEKIAEYSKQYNKQYKEANREKIAEHNKQYREANKEKIAEYSKQYSKQYYEVNREKRAEYNKQWRETNREKIAEYKKQYNNQLCKYNNETLTLSALRNRFLRAGVEHPAIEAKRYLIV